jgi:hypothetical protein
MRVAKRLASPHKASWPSVRYAHGPVEDDDQGVRRMILIRALAALAVSLALATPAAAAITFDVDGVFGAPGGTLTGAFTTDDAATAVTAVHLVSSYNGAFVGATYSDVADIDADSAWRAPR